MTKILIVEDNDALRTLLRYTLVAKQYVILEAENGFQALEIAEKESPDFVILDIMMPEMSGLSVCTQMKSMPNMSNSKIIILSALTQKKDIEKGLEAGADRYMSKPFTPSELIKLIDEMQAD